MTRDAVGGCGGRYPRWIDRAFVRGLGARRWRRLRRHLRGCQTCRRHYDRLAHANRVLQPSRPLFPGSLEFLAREVGRAAEASHRGRQRWLGLGAAVAAAAVLLLVLWPAKPDGGGFEARGPDDDIGPFAGERRPGVRLFCVSTETHTGEVVAHIRLTEPTLPVEAVRCKITDELQLAYSTPSFEGLTMVAFAKDSEGIIRWYAPRAGHDTSVAVAADSIDEPLEWSTRLAVHHTPGVYEVTVRFFEGPVTAGTAAMGIEDPVFELRGRLELSGGPQ